MVAIIFIGEDRIKFETWSHGIRWRS